MCVGLSEGAGGRRLQNKVGTQTHSPPDSKPQGKGRKVRDRGRQDYPSRAVEVVKRAKGQDALFFSYFGQQDRKRSGGNRIDVCVCVVSEKKADTTGCPKKVVF